MKFFPILCMCVPAAMVCLSAFSGADGRGDDGDVRGWLADSCGCEGMRSFELANRIIDRYGLEGAPVDSLFKYMGYGVTTLYYDLEGDGSLADDSLPVIELCFDADGRLRSYGAENFRNTFCYFAN